MRGPQPGAKAPHGGWLITVAFKGRFLKANRVAAAVAILAYGWSRPAATTDVAKADANNDATTFVLKIVQPQRQSENGARPHPPHVITIPAGDSQPELSPGPEPDRPGFTRGAVRDDEQPPTVAAFASAATGEAGHPREGPVSSRSERDWDFSIGCTLWGFRDDRPVATSHPHGRSCGRRLRDKLAGTVSRLSAH
jgi:hypothetical protein